MANIDGAAKIKPTPGTTARSLTGTKEEDAARDQGSALGARQVARRRDAAEQDEEIHKCPNIGASLRGLHGDPSKISVDNSGRQFNLQF